jgi:hypothetical protein
MDQGKAVLRIREKNRELQTPIFWGPFSLRRRFWADFGCRFGWIFDFAFSTVLDVDFGWFCPGLQFTVKRRVYLCFRPLGTRF